MLSSLLADALTARADLLDRLHAEHTTCYRLFHGAAEGRPGLSVDRYGPILLAQTFRDPLSEQDVADLQAFAAELDLSFVWNHRGKSKKQRWNDFHEATWPDDPICHEAGLSFDATPRHRGIDPLLFLDFRAARARVREAAKGLSVLNLFAYTCGIGLAAAAGGASKVVNVDFATSNLAVGKANGERNELTNQQFIHEDVFPVIRQLAGLKLGGRHGRRPRFTPMKPESFDIVVLDPPRFAKSKWGVVDLINDYPALFKPALLATKPGGRMLVTNNVGKVAVEDWADVLQRAAKKAGRPIERLERFHPEPDFPSRDGRPPLKQAWLTV